MKSLIVLGKGDTNYSDRNRRRLVQYAKSAGFDVLEADYAGISGLPRFKHEKAAVVFFFPFTFWNAHCEVPQDTGLYGTSRATYDLFSAFFHSVRRELDARFGKGNLHYLIPPENAPVDRDKIETIRRMRTNGVPTSEPVVYASLQDILDAVTPARGVFLKCRYGAEGKGITVLHHGRWRTNYQVVDGRLTNYGVYDTWPFTDITGRRELLEQLLETAVIVEHEILTPQTSIGVIKPGTKFDMRVYVVGETVPHFFVRYNDPNAVVTNYSQGGTVIHHPNTGLDEGCVGNVQAVARDAARAMGLEFVGVDIMFDGSVAIPRVVEVQAFTDFPDIRNFNLAQYMVGQSGLFI